MLKSSVICLYTRFDHSSALPYNISLFADQETWIAAYAAWYAHFLAMLPPDCPYRLAESWTRKMTEASMGLAFFQRDDQKIIAENGINRAMKNVVDVKNAKNATTCRPMPDNHRQEHITARSLPQKQETPNTQKVV